jgi:hypothetical protein
MYSSARAVFHVLEELVGHVDRLQRSLLFAHSRLDEGPISFIYRSSAPRASRIQIDAFIAKRQKARAFHTAPGRISANAHPIRVRPHDEI